MIGEGPAARSIKLDLQPFTLVGATTRAGMLTNPLRDRFGIVARLEFYTPEELARIVRAQRRPAERADRRRGRAGDRAPLARHAAHRQPPAAPRARLRRRERQRPHHADIADKALAMLDVDPQGFDVMDRKLLRSGDPPLRRRPGGPGQRRRRHRRGARHDRGRDRALPDPAGLPAAHAARAHRHAGGVPAPGRGAAGTRRAVRTCSAGRRIHVGPEARRLARPPRTRRTSRCRQRRAPPAALRHRAAPASPRRSPTAAGVNAASHTPTAPAAMVRMPQEQRRRPEHGELQPGEPRHRA